MKIQDYEIVDKIEDEENYEYEEITLRELLYERLSLTEKERCNIVRREFAVNIHYMLSLETYDKAFEIVNDIATDPRLKGLNAIVFLQYKNKGMNTDKFHCIPSVDAYKRLISHCESKNVSYGFDSCSAPLFFQSIKDRPEAERLIQMAEPCESFGMFSSYINVKAEYFPCSFSEGEKDWEEGMNVLECDDFLKDIWFSEKLNKWRNIMLKSSESCDCDMAKHCRSCPIFDITACKHIKKDGNR